MGDEEASMMEENAGSARNLELAMVRTLIEASIDRADCGLFFTRNILGDEMETIFGGEFFTVDICYGYAYFEVFGCTYKEADELMKFYDGCLGRLRTRRNYEQA